MVGDFPVEQWTKTFGKSNGRHLDETIRNYTLQDKCSESDGDPCRFLRILKVNNYIVGYNCIFDKCIKRYPTEEELEGMR